MKSIIKSLKDYILNLEKKGWVIVISTLVIIASFFTTVINPVISFFSKTEIIIKGEWNDMIADEYFINILEDRKGDTIYHKLIGFYTTHDGISENKIALYYSRDKEHDCHVCDVDISVFEIENKEGKWIKKEEYINAFQDGSYGKPPTKMLALTIGYGKYGILAWGHYMQHGFIDEWITLHTPLGKKMSEVLKEYVHEDDEGAHPRKDNKYTNWTSEIEFIKEGYGFYDIKITKKGKKEGKKFTETNIYKFNGEKYLIDYGINVGNSIWIWE